MDLLMHKLATQDDGEVDQLLIRHNYEPPSQSVTNGRGFVAFGFLGPTVNEPRLSKGGSMAKLLLRII